MNRILSPVVNSRLKKIATNASDFHTEEELHATTSSSDWKLLESIRDFFFLHAQSSNSRFKFCAARLVYHLVFSTMRTRTTCFHLQEGLHC
mmetsp:Transcript_48451/g.151944  ORF Transcript_48451/g.151944 Transcript_48451/m.151944 type:complete len:91 (+) Transcript_48451:376-648(+)